MRDDITILELAQLQAKFGQTASVLMRQITEGTAKKHNTRFVLMRQIRERMSDLEACEEIADTMSDASWGMF